MTEQRTNVYAPPEVIRPSPTVEGRQFLKYSDELNAAGDLGVMIYQNVIRSLERAYVASNTVADAEQSVIEAQLMMEKNGASAAGLVQQKGKIHAIPTQWDELAQTAKPALDIEIDKMDRDIQAMARNQDAIVAKMDASLVCAHTRADPQLRSDIRNHFKAMGSHKAKGAAAKAAMDGDLPTIHTILTGPIQLMGLSSDDVELVRKYGRQKLSPALCRAHEIGAEALDVMVMSSRGLGQKREAIQTYRLKDQEAANNALSKVRNMARTA
ncbi:MAG: hypothetical protein ABJ327_01915 [Litoreibacter sp.]